MFDEVVIVHRDEDITIYLLLEVDGSSCRKFPTMELPQNRSLRGHLKTIMVLKSVAYEDHASSN
jgi:hypothetical protein